MRLFEQRVHLVTGKGGVGRTTVAAALAHAASSQNQRVLLAEIDHVEGDHSALAQCFGRETLAREPMLLAPNLWACRLWANTGHVGFLKSVLPAGPLIQAALRSKALRKFLAAVPSFHEMGIFYHLLTLLKAEEKNGMPTYETIIIDMPATGHALALTGLPEILLRLLPGGPIARAMRQGQFFIKNPKQGAAWVVTLPEQLPVSEALELIDGLEQTEMPVAGVVLNRFLANPFTAAEGQALEDLFADQPLHGELAYRRMGTARRAEERLLGATSLPIVKLPEVMGAKNGTLSYTLAESLLSYQDQDQDLDNREKRDNDSQSLEPKQESEVQTEQGRGDV